jgi:hypothetical protein
LVRSIYLILLKILSSWDILTFLLGVNILKAEKDFTRWNALAYLEGGNYHNQFQVETLQLIGIEKIFHKTEK